MFSLEITALEEDTMVNIADVHKKLYNMYIKLSQPNHYNRDVISKRINTLERKKIKLVGQLEIYGSLMENRIYEKNADEQLIYFTTLLTELLAQRKDKKDNDSLNLKGKIDAVRECIAWTRYIEGMTNDWWRGDI